MHSYYGYMGLFNSESAPHHEVKGESVFRKLYKPNSTRITDWGRIWGRVRPDILDNLSTAEAPPTVQGEGNNSIIMERFFPLSERKELIDRANTIPPGRSKGAVTVVGHIGNHTSHPHLFDATRYAESPAHPAYVELLFIDPEATVGQHNLLRPSITNLLAARVYDSSNYPMEFASLRFRTETFQPSELRLPAMYQVAKTLLDTRGLPPILEGKSNEILFRLFSDGQGSEVQTRYSSLRKMRRFLQGKKGSSAIEGKVASSRHIFRRFLALLAAPEQFESAFGEPPDKATEQYNRLLPKLTRSTV